MRCFVLNRLIACLWLKEKLLGKIFHRQRRSNIRPHIGGLRETIKFFWKNCQKFEVPKSYISSCFVANLWAQFGYPLTVLFTRDTSVLPRLMYGLVELKIMTAEFNNFTGAIPNEAMILDCLLTPAKAARILGISKKLLHELCRQRKLEYVQIGSRRRFTQTQLQAFIDSQTIKSPAIDKKPSKRLDCPRKGGEKSFGNGANLRKEMKQWR